MTPEQANERLRTAFDALRSGNLTEAKPGFEAVKLCYPEAFEALQGLGVVLFRQGDVSGALLHLHDALEIAPNSAPLRFDIGCVYEASGETARAIDEFATALRLSPDHQGAWVALARCLLQEGRRGEAESALRHAMRQRHMNLEGAGLLTRLLRDKGALDEAIVVWRDYVATPPLRENAYAAFGQFLTESNETEAARDLYATALAYFPNSPDLRAGFGQVFEYQGDRAAAERQYVRALQIDPNRAFAISALLQMVGASAPDEVVRHAEGLVKNARVRPGPRALIGYGLGKVFHGRKDYARAFEAWRQANADRQAEVGVFDESSIVRRIDGIVSGEHALSFDERSPVASSDQRPVLVVGMPRSGTTLVEQIIASHPQADGLGELQDLPVSADMLLADVHSGDSEKVRQATANAVQNYLKALDRRSSADKLRLVDKAPMNFFHVDVFRYLFPHGRVLWCRRDPRDVCLSIYTENFSKAQTYATDLRGLGVFYRQHERLMQHWRQDLGIEIFEVVYEDLINDFSTVSRRMIEFIQLDWHPNCASFHEHERSVQTPSRWQVRRPIYGSSVGKWKHYEQWLGPLFDALKVPDVQNRPV